MVENKKYSDLELLYSIYTAKDKTRSLYRMSHDMSMSVSSLYIRLKKLTNKGILIKKRRGRKTIFLMNPVFVKKNKMDNIIMYLLPVLKDFKNNNVTDVSLAIDFIFYISSEL